MNVIGDQELGGGIVVGEEEEQGGGGGGGGGGVEGGAVDGSNASKAVAGAITETVIVGSTTYYPMARSLPCALSVAYAALFLTILLFLVILLLLLLLLLLRRRLPRLSGSGGGGAVKFAERAAVAVAFLVPLLALAAQAYAALK